MVGGQIQLLVISQYDAACLAQNSRLGLNKFSLMHYGLYKGNPYNALDAAQTFKAFLQEGQWALK